MRAVVLGDIGWKSQYHVGDEAMTEVALEQLRERGVDDLTVVSGEPDVGSALYGLPAVPRIGYHRPWSRERLEATRQRLELALVDPEKGTPQMTSLIEAIRTADAAVIAGGGNLNSDHAYHLFERWSFARIAEHLGVPLFVMSQTVGPHLFGDDRDMVLDMIRTSRFFGVRDRFTALFLAEIGGNPSKIAHTMDDAVLLPARSDDHSGQRPAHRYIVASFTDNPPAAELGVRPYPEILASVLDDIAREFDVDVTLVPHVGSLEVGVVKADEALNEQIIAASASGRISALTTRRARDVVVHTSGAMASISTRYHQAVFSAAVGVPSVAIASSEYDHVRMSGAYENLGLSGYVLPAGGLLDRAVVAVIGELVDGDSDTRRAELREISTQREQDQRRVWDAVVAAIGDGTTPEVVSLLSLRNPIPLWAQLSQTALEVSRMLWMAEERRRRSEHDRDRLAADTSREIGELRRQLTAATSSLEQERSTVRDLKSKAARSTERIIALEQSLHASQNRLAARIANRLVRMVRPLRRGLAGGSKKTENSAR